MLFKARVHASLPAADLARARAFYEEKLGLSPLTGESAGLGL
jgi:catechol 2,3-dioxygenase-like lactoylglutathione lyase family enzyme